MKVDQTAHVFCPLLLLQPIPDPTYQVSPPSAFSIMKASMPIYHEFAICVPARPLLTALPSLSFALLDDLHAYSIMATY